MTQVPSLKYIQVSKSALKSICTASKFHQQLMVPPPVAIKN